MFSDYPYVSGTTKTLVAHFKETAERLAATYDLKPGDLVVDIGSNDGTWLKQYQPLGLDVLGVDPASNVVELALKAGVPTWARFFNEQTAAEIVEKKGHASLVTAAGVFFHLEELHSVIRGVRALIGDDGVFVVQAIYLGGMIENTAFDQVYHEHLVYYTLRSIEALFARHGLEVFDTRLVPIHGGTIEVHVAPEGAPACPGERRAHARRGAGEEDSANSRHTAISPPASGASATTSARCSSATNAPGNQYTPSAHPQRAQPSSTASGSDPTLFRRPPSEIP